MARIRNQQYASPPSVEGLLRYAQYVLFFMAVLGLGYAGFVVAKAQIYRAEESRHLEHAAKLDARALPAGSPIGRVKVSRIGLDAVVVQGDSDSILRLAVGHIPGTALPGQSGNAVLAGHRDTFFRALRNIRVGDRIAIESPNGSYNYEVKSASIVVPTDLSPLRNSGNKELTLITCYPFSWIGSAPDRFVVRAIAN